ncbi:M14 family zinc carboxypeptidase [Nonlabens xiamenensis]|uniref:M14 family zinc carboxypeptidase n=1 Tax=Nonlabens xiamenensis TaxID=2341043 RepID=UPI000F60E4C3|nr:M14 family zinc carboxypeptidase [Nonlabens xiamenensis]
MSFTTLPRYFSYTDFEQLFKQLCKSLPSGSYRLDVIGSSVLKQPIYGLQIGSGDTKVLLWSQMHGNESTLTRALLFLLASGKLVQNLSNLSLYIIPVLNPDGATAWTRNNANNVDLNRDALELSQPESQLLHKVFHDFQPNFCLNLHDQRTIYGNKEGTMPVQASFLSPAGDIEKTIGPQRLLAMQIINHLYSIAETRLSGLVGRYKDDFNPNCWGDWMTLHQAAVVLFEAGHAGDDYARDEITAVMTDLLHASLIFINRMPVLNDKTSIIDAYTAIPNIATNYCDILIKNHKDAKSDFQNLQVSFHEQVVEGELYFVPILIGVNRNDILNGHRVIDLSKDSDYQKDIEISASLVLTSESLGINIFANKF